jgi:hypoxanthine phosphoribosyltransferase
MKKINKVYFVVCMFIIGVYHFCIHNSLEKLFFQTYLTKNIIIKRPSESCKNLIYEALNCVGMPSGHAETTTIIFVLLYLYKFIPLSISLFFIALFSIQRIIANRHTTLQVIIGILFGFIYSQIYFLNNLSWISFVSVFLIGFILCNISIYKLDKIINQPIPKWVDPTMFPNIEKKQNTPLYSKILHIYYNNIYQEITIINWNTLEKYLDITIDKIRETNVKFDGIVGIKTGGAIISDYISKKLNIPNYKIKLSREEYNCNKKTIHTFNDIYNKRFNNNFGKYTICEKIPDSVDLKNKNIILIDELVSTGTTMIESINYLSSDKEVNYIYPISISLDTTQYNYKIDIQSIISIGIHIWPWGYDN